MHTPAPPLQKAKQWFGYRKMPPPAQSIEEILSKRHPLLHWSSVVGYGALLLAAIHGTKHAVGALLLALFMVATSIPMLLRNWKMLLLILGIIALSATFPPLAPAFLIVFVLFYLRRLLMVLTHWRPVLSGLLLYTSVVFVQGIAIVTDPSTSSSAPEVLEEAVRMRVGIGLIVVPVGAFCFHRLLHWLNRHHYNTQTALAVMGVFPLLLLALVMPLFKFDLGIEVPEIPAEAPAGGLIAEGSLVAEGTLAAQSSAASTLEASAAQHATLQAQETTVLTGLNNAKTAIPSPYPTTALSTHSATSLAEANAETHALLSSKTAAATASARSAEADLDHPHTTASTHSTETPSDHPHTTASTHSIETPSDHPHTTASTHSTTPQTNPSPAPASQESDASIEETATDIAEEVADQALKIQRTAR